MDIKTTISISDARKNLFAIADAVQKPDTCYILTENGRPKVALMSAEEFESRQETIETLQDFPDLKKDIEEAEKDYTSGAYKNYPTLEEILAEEGFVLADKGKKKYAVSHHRQTKRAQKSQKHTR